MPNRSGTALPLLLRLRQRHRRAPPVEQDYVVRQGARGLAPQRFGRGRQLRSSFEVERRRGGDRAIRYR